MSVPPTRQKRTITQPTVVQPTPARRQFSVADVLIPLRLFLGVSFLAAGLDKLTDPEFFDSQKLGYIGNQLNGFANQSPLGPFLTNVAVPNATIFGAMVLAGELAIGLGTLVGLFSRVAAIFGFILSMTLWLTATWAVTPFFLGADLPYAMGWLTLALAGAHPVLSLDALLTRRGWVWNKPVVVNRQVGSPADGSVRRPAAPVVTSNEPTSPSIARRHFISVTGGTILAGAITGVAWLHSLREGSQTTATTGTTTTPAQSASQPTPGAAPAAATGNGKVVASLASLAVGDAQKFKTPDTGEAGILIRQQDGSVKAFSTVCTHEGCEVGFVKAQQILACPCHGAQFDIQTGAATRRPANRPLKAFNVSVENGNIIYTQS